jgi:hypothetical protein
MRASASKHKPACLRLVRFCRSGDPTLSHMSDAGGTPKRCANWAFVSPVSPVSPNLKLIERIQKKKVGNGREGINCPQGPCAETGGTSAKVAGVCGETTGAGHRWDRWDLPSACRGAKSATLKPCGLRGLPRSPDARQSNAGREPQIRRKLRCDIEWKQLRMNSSSAT